MDGPQGDMAAKTQVPGLEAATGVVEWTTLGSLDSNAKQKDSETQPQMGGDEDSIYDASMNGETDDEAVSTKNDLEGRPSPQAVSLTTNSQNVESKKRKSLSPGTNSSTEGDALAAQLSKKPRLEFSSNEAHRDKSLPDDLSTLPSEVWHHIFTFCPPKTLGNLLRVNKLFHVYLDPSSSFSPSSSTSLAKSAVGILKPNEIWKASRGLFWPLMPAQLRSMTELEIWRLVSSTRCQACNKEGTRDLQDSPDPWHYGPGMEGVSIIWCFAIRCCGPCLLQRVVKVRFFQFLQITPQS